MQFRSYTRFTVHSKRDSSPLQPSICAPPIENRTWPASTGKLAQPGWYELEIDDVFWTFWSPLLERLVYGNVLPITYGRGTSIFGGRGGSVVNDGGGGSTATAAVVAAWP
ncbi:hypothetical protein B0H10DRAFT_2066700 [Mycena sp. CBHHK59/15]|nr:hypothetical protein B0H10DRAFT_2066700 [Mycena sp. CBHHK59/15]